MPLWDSMSSWLERPFLGNALWRWGAALLTLIATFLVLRIVQRWSKRRLDALAGRTTNRVDNIIGALIGKTQGLFLLALAVLAGSAFLALDGRGALVRQAVVFLTFLQVAIWASALFISVLEEWQRRKGIDASTSSLLSSARFFGRVLIWAVILLIALDNLGVQVTALIAGLGVGGIAIALAVQSLLGDLFACISIVLDKPFELGDFIIVGDLMGTVQHIGLKTTRLRSLSGEQLVFSNSDLLSSRIRNFKRMQERRIVFSLGVTYQTPREKVAAIPGMLRSIVESSGEVRFDRAHFARLGDSALEFEVVYFVLKPDYNVYMDIQQAINLALLARFAEEGIEFAYPTRTLFIQREG